MYGHHILYSKSKDRPGKVATSPAVPSRVSLLIYILRLNLVLTLGIPPDFRGGVHVFISTAIRHRVSPEFIGSRNRVLMAFIAESLPARGQ